MRFWSSLRFRNPKVAETSRDAERRQELLLICHAGDHVSLEVMENICKGLEFLKIQFSVFDLQRGTAWPSLDGFGSVVICTENIWRLEFDKAARLIDYTANGGGLAVVCRGWNDHLTRLFGLKENLTEPNIHITSGMFFHANIFPGIQGLRMDDSDREFDHSRFEIDAEHLHSDCEILASDLGDRPVAWRQAFGLGKIVYWNTEVLFCRALRGFAVQTVLGTMPVAVGAVAGFAMIHVDDFPPSLSDEIAEPISTEYPGTSRSDFYFGAWYDDMMAMRAKHDLKYTWYTVMNYHDAETAADSDLNSPEVMSGQSELERRFRHVRHTADDDEFGFHGYNHEPLISKSWPDTNILECKLRLARDLWEKAVPAPLPVSWVPAANWYDQDRIRLLKKVFPEITEVCSLFSSGEQEFGEYREFGPEPWEPSLTCLPRETCGYIQQPEYKMMMLSQIASMGVWTHFVHPDDVYDVPATPNNTNYARNESSLFWKASSENGQPGLYAQFEAWIAEARQLFPWLEFVTTSQAAQRLRSHEQNRVEIIVTDTGVEIISENAGLFFLRTGKNTTVTPGQGGQLLDRHHLADGILNTVKCAAGKTVFSLEND